MKIFALSFLLLGSSLFAGSIHPSIQKAIILKSESSSESGKKTDHHAKGAIVTFFDLSQNEPTVYIETKDPSYSSKRTYVKTYSSGNEITLKRKGAERYVDAIFINTDTMEFVIIECAYLMGTEFNCTTSEGKLTKN